MTDKQPVQLFQFWDRSPPPPEISALLQSWKDDSHFSYNLFDQKTADEFIDEHFDDRALAAFRRCAIPAMQADFFRYCALYVHGGVYVDADTANPGGLNDFVSKNVRGILMQRQRRVANDFLYVAAAGDELFRVVIEQAIRNVEDEISNNVWKVTGPGIMTKLFHDEETKPLFDGFIMEPASTIRQVVAFKHDLEYKRNDQDWRKNLSTDAPSIFKKDA